MKKLLLTLALSLSAAVATAQDSAGSKACSAPCVNVPCESECWSVRVHYRRDGVLQVGGDGTFWGSISGATCHADYIADHGFWIAEWEHPTKIPASMIDLVVIDREVPSAK